MRSTQLTLEELRCDNQQNPLAVQEGHPQFSWKITGNPTERGVKQIAYRILVSSSTEFPGHKRGDFWDSGKVYSSKTIEIAYHGRPLQSFATYYWSATVWDNNHNESQLTGTASFSMGALQASDWKARWIANGSGSALPLFRYAFSVTKPVKSATGYVSGLGQYELEINGRKIGNQVLAPGWTNYRKTVFYNAYDLTHVLQQGRNAIGIMLGNGMYRVEDTPERYTKFSGSFGEPKAIFQALITFADGTSFMVTSDVSWKVHDGPITFSSIYGGEDYDARQEQAGWSSPGFRDDTWTQAKEVSGPGGALTSQENPELVVAHTYEAQRVTMPFSYVHVYDLGQNFAGWPEITVQGLRGSSVKLVCGELLDATGFVRQTSSGEPQWFSYTLSGNGNETWHPRFSYYGFRYVQVESRTTSGSQFPEVLSVRGQFIHAKVATVGTFRCSDELLNRIHLLINAAILSNMESVLTDCPHREKLGWLEETHLLGSSVMYNYNVVQLYRKIADDMRDTQQRNGFLPEIAPEYPVFSDIFHDSPEWSSAIVLDPWIAYQHYGSKSDLAKHYPEMKRYADYLKGKANDGILAYGLGDWYDIGPGEPGPSKLTTMGVTGTAIYYADLTTLEKVARVLDMREDAQVFHQLADAIKATFNKHFYDARTHVYDRGSQTAYAMPLALDLVPPKDRGFVLNNLVEDIRQHSNHVTAGDIGFHSVVEALMNGGRSDVLYDMLSRTDPPSYGYQLAMGATSLTEAWDANPLDSQNHFMLGHAEEWFYRGLAGIDFDLSRSPEDRIIIRPSPVESIQNAEAHYDSVLGTIHVKWSQNSEIFSLDVTIPPNCAAKIYLPAESANEVKENGEGIRQDSNLSFLKQDLHSVLYRAASGVYHFTVQH